MKKRFVIPVLIAAIALVGGFGINAMAVSDDFGASWGKCDEKGPGSGMHGFGRLATALDLTDEQEAQIEAIIAAERPAMRPLREQIREGRSELRNLSRQGAFDEAAVREVASRLAETKTEMMVARTRVKSKIFAVLTPEQQELAEKLQPLVEKGRGRHHRPF